MRELNVLILLNFNIFSLEDVMKVFNWDFFFKGVEIVLEFDYNI